MIEIRCNDSLSITKQWKLKNCSTTCSNEIQFDSQILLTSSELFIPSRTLPYGIYEFELIIAMTKYPSLKTSSLVYVEITPSGITANLVQLGTSMITSGHELNLELNPGRHSIDLDADTFNSTVSLESNSNEKSADSFAEFLTIELTMSLV